MSSIERWAMTPKVKNRPLAERPGGSNDLRLTATVEHGERGKTVHLTFQTIPEYAVVDFK